MAATDIRDNLSKVYKWLGFLIEYYENNDDDENNAKLASQMRDNPNEPLDALIQMRMSHVTYVMRTEMIRKEGDPIVKRKDLTKMMKSFAPVENNEWWPVWMDYLKVMNDSDWTKMWIDVDDTVKEMLSSK